MTRIPVSIYSFGLMLTLFGCMTLFSKQASAQVILEKGIIEKEIVDLELSDGEHLFELIRNYHQAAGKGSGILGARWCFDFEERILEESGGYKVFKCGIEQETFFKKTSKNQYAFDLETLEVQKGGTLHRKIEDDTFVYNENGFLIERRFQSKKRKIVQYNVDDSGTIQSISYLGKQQLDFVYDKNGMASEVLTKGRRVAAYSVLEKRLMSAKNGWGESVVYDYTDTGLLSSIDHQDGNKEEFSYSKKGLISEHKLMNGCVRNYGYERVEKGAHKGQLRLSLLDSCIPEDPIKIAFDEKLQNLNQSKKSKERISKLKKSKAKEEYTRFAVGRDDKGRIISLFTESATWHMKYDEELNKLIEITRVETKKKKSSSYTYVVKYKNNRLVEIAGKGKSKSKESIKYVYSKKGELLKVKSKGKEAGKLALINRFAQLNKVQVASNL